MNLMAKFKRLLPASPMLVGEVAAHNADGTSTITTPAGGTVRVQGQDVTVGEMAFYQDGRVLCEAQALPTYELEV
ncbi:MAG: hypothetical protein EOM25_12590 [Deltaproteobacteria bacterium]|nr:hypothetical protein [Deltaproteobacteria bacterium]